MRQDEVGRWYSTGLPFGEEHERVCREGKTFIVAHLRGGEVVAKEATKPVWDEFEDSTASYPQWCRDLGRGWCLVRALSEDEAKSRFSEVMDRVTWLDDRYGDWGDYLEAGGTEERFLSDDYET